MSGAHSTTAPIGTSANYRWYVIGMLWFIAFFNYADRQAIFSVFPLLEKEMGLSKTQLGFVGASFGWVYGIGALFAGLIVDKVSRKKAILWGLHVWSIICIATASSQRYGHLLFFRMAEGLGETFYFPASMSLVSDYHTKRTRSRAMGLHQTSVYAGTIAGAVFAGLIADHYGWRWSFIVFGGCGIVLGLVLQRFLIEPSRGAADYADAGVAVKEGSQRRLPVKEVLAEVWSKPTALVLMAAFLCANFVAAVLLSWMPSLAAEKFDYKLAMAGLTATIYVQLASMCSAPLGGWMADALRKRIAGGRMAVQAIAVLCCAPFVALCGMSQSVGIFILALTCWGFFKGLYDANIFASVYDVIRPEARGTAAGFMNTVGWLGGGGTAPIVIGYIADRSGGDLGFAIATASVVYVAAGIILLIGVFFFIRRDSERMQASLDSTRFA